MSVPGYVPPAGQVESSQLARAIRDLYSGLTSGPLEMITDEVAIAVSTPDAQELGATSIATMAKFVDGSSTDPHTSYTPTIAISRVDAMQTDTFAGTTALVINNVSTGVGPGNPNSGCITANATQLGVGDIAGIAANVLMDGTGAYTAFGGFFNAEAANSGAGCIGAQIGADNQTGDDVPYDPDTIFDAPFTVGLDVAAGSATGDRSQAIIFARVGGVSGPVDCGIAFHPGSGSIGQADIRTDTDSPTILYAGPSSHTNGIDLSDATISGSAFKSSGFNVDGAGEITAAGAAYNATTPTPTASAGSFTTVSCTVREKFVGKTVFLQVEVTITNVGTATGSVFVSVPTAAAHATAGSYGNLANGSIVGTALINSNQIIITPVTLPIASGDTIKANFVYERA